MTTQPDTATSGAAAPRAVPNHAPAASFPKPTGFAATDVLVNEYDGGPDTVQRALNTQHLVADGVAIAQGCEHLVDLWSFHCQCSVQNRARWQLRQHFRRRAQ